MRLIKKQIIEHRLLDNRQNNVLMRLMRLMKNKLLTLTS